MQLRAQSNMLVLPKKGQCRQGDKCLFPHRGEKGILLTKEADPNKATNSGQHVPAGDGKAGARADQNKAALAPSPKIKAAAKKNATAAPQQQPPSDAERPI